MITFGTIIVLITLLTEEEVNKMSKATLLPADTYQVVNKSFLTEAEEQILTMLYMPIVGSNAIVLYLSLYSELKMSNFMTTSFTHHHLITTLSLSLEEVKEARIKLEGISLLKTYFMEGSVNSYIYELYAPLPAYEFFSHPIFNMVLYNNIGSIEYKRVLNYFKAPVINLKDYTDITTSFDNAFTSSSYTQFELEGVNIIKKDKLKLNYELDYDFDFLISSMPKNLFNERALNKTTKELIINLSFLYNIDPLVMSDLVKASLNEKGLIDKEELRKNTRKYYQFNNDNRLPSLLFKTERKYLRSPSGDNSKRGMLIHVFESTSPYEFLKSKNKGVKPSEKDMKTLETLLLDVNLNPAVINVLIDYVLRINNNKLTSAFVLTIATQWKRAGIETASDAMEFAEKEHSKRMKRKEKTVVGNKYKKEEIVPSWFNEKLSKTQTSVDEQKELEEMLKEFKK